MPTKIHAPDKQRNKYLALMHSSPQIIRSQKNTLNREGPQPCSTKGKNMPLICFPITCFYNPQFLLFTMVLESHFYPGNTLHPHQIFLFKTTLVQYLQIFQNIHLRIHNIKERKVIPGQAKLHSRQIETSGPSLMWVLSQHD